MMPVLVKQMLNFLRGRPALLRSHPNLDQALCSLLMKDRLRLPEVCALGLFPDYERHPVELYQVPRGSWSTPLADLVLIVKVALCTGATNLLEVGSFRGYTALSLAQHAREDARIVTIDKFPTHGEAYLETPYAAKIERRVGPTSAEMFSGDEAVSYDLIYLDADHSYDCVKRDTELVLPLLAEEGLILWHDYANWGYSNATNGVPEYFNELSRDIPIVHIMGSRVAIHSPSWLGEQHRNYERALASAEEADEGDAWVSNRLRG